jgi:hypothetical protein
VIEASHGGKFRTSGAAIPGAAIIGAAIPGAAIIGAAIPGAAIIGAAIPGSTIADSVRINLLIMKA